MELKKPVPDNDVASSPGFPAFSAPTQKKAESGKPGMQSHVSDVIG